MQGEAFRQLRKFRPVQKIPRQGTAQTRHVAPELKGPSGVQGQLYKTASAAPAQKAVMGPGGSALRVDLPHQHRPRQTADGLIHPPLLLGRCPLAYGQISPPKLSRLKLGLETLVGIGVLGHRHEAGGPPVQAVHRMKPRRKPLGLVVVEDEICQGVPVVALAGMDRDAPGLVHDEQVLVLIADVQGTRNGLDGIASLLVSHHHREGLPQLDPGRGEDGGPV